MKDPFFEKR